MRKINYVDEVLDVSAATSPSYDQLHFVVNVFTADLPKSASDWAGAATGQASSVIGDAVK